MAEYINKAELLKEISNIYFETDRPLSEKESKQIADNFMAITGWIRQYTENMPTVDIVHCKECIYCDGSYCNGYNYDEYGSLRFVDGNFFCADGKRKPALKHADEETLQSAT